MTTPPTTLGELFRALEITLTVRPVAGEDEAWACALSRPDGRMFEIESVSFFDVDPETGDEWIVEPSPTRVLGVLAGGEIEAEDEEGEDAAGDAEAAARAFLGDEAYELLLRLDEEDLG